ncbi:hypothetical protein [Streptomyces sp. NPDC018693]
MTLLVGGAGERRVCGGRIVSSWGDRGLRARTDVKRLPTLSDGRL